MGGRKDLRRVVEDIPGKGAFAGRGVLALPGAVEPQKRQVLRLDRAVGNAGRGDDQTVAPPGADIARRALIETARIHLQAMRDDAAAQRQLVHGLYSSSLSRVHSGLAFEVATNILGDPVARRAD